MTPDSLLSQEIRAQYCLTQTALAKRVRVSPSLISKIERGHRIMGGHILNRLIDEFPDFKGGKMRLSDRANRGREKKVGDLFKELERGIISAADSGESAVVFQFGHHVDFDIIAAAVSRVTARFWADRIRFSQEPGPGDYRYISFEWGPK